MSRHRRQQSQVLPPEILSAAEDLPNSFDFSQITANQQTTATTTTTTPASKQTPPTNPPPPATTNKPPPPKSH
ncbi:unnamed protein product [Lupinus luteus]|uniref:Uncharacterized protein n=1 Tax=Lupinus luteus TaxID=3873 RepID=A0AAV1X2G2_LUPLU